MEDKYGYTHKIVEVHPRDGHYHRKDLIGRHCEPLEDVATSNSYEGYLAGEVRIEDERSDGSRYFHAVKLEEL